tara:strand:- start:1333 stop:2250 length:918 start_codon:yes stop_codon:yes gene_type:complete
MKILVFGSNGLVGSAVKRNLTNQHEGMNLLFSTREDTNLFSFNETKRTIESFGPNVIINAAAKVGGILANNTHRTSFIMDNLKINLNILESCIDNSDIKIINLGSSCIYPLNAPNPIKEDSFMNGKLEPTNSPYAMAKLSAIELGSAMSLEFGHKIVNLMPTNLYGPNDNFSPLDSHVIPGLISRMNKAKDANLKEFEIWGSGKPLREFLYVDDLADAIDFIIKKDINDSLINIGSGEEISILNLAEKIKNILNFEGSLVFNNDIPDGNPRKLLDSSLINSYGWSPTTDLDTGLDNTFNWYLQNS